MNKKNAVIVLAGIGVLLLAAIFMFVYIMAFSGSKNTDKDVPTVIRSTNAGGNASTSSDGETQGNTSGSNTQGSSGTGSGVSTSSSSSGNKTDAGKTTASSSGGSAGSVTPTKPTDPTNSNSSNNTSKPTTPTQTTPTTKPQVPDDIVSLERFFDSKAIDGTWLTNELNKLLIDTKDAPGYTLEVSKGGKVIYKEYQGNQNIQRESATKIYSADSIFEVQSVTKPVIATLVFKCIEDGLININDTVKKYSPDMFFDDVTIYHLLTHSGGYNAHELNSVVKWDGKRRTLPQYIKDVYQFNKRSFTPGTSSQYYDGYLLLMDIVEKVTKKPIEEYAQEVLFGPLDMTSSHMDERLLDRSRFIVVNNYSKERGTDHLIQGSHLRPCYGNAGLFTTADDLMNFTLMFRNKGYFNGKQILKEKTFKDMITKCPEYNFDRTPAFFMSVGSAKGTFGDLASSTTIGHAGHSGTTISMDFENDITCVFLSNNSVTLTQDKAYQPIRDALTLAYKAIERKR